jgi:RNA polymerase sigma-70 factor (ECF subfamily)
VNEVLNGNKEAYAVLFERYENLVYRLALIQLGDAEQARDILQEAFLTAYKSLDRLKKPESFGPWLARLTKNICFNQMRKKRIKTASLEYLEEKGLQPAAVESNESEGLEEQIKAMRRVIRELPEVYREIIELRYSRELSYEKIGKFLNLSMSAVKSRLFNARKRIAKMLKVEGVS